MPVHVSTCMCTHVYVAAKSCREEREDELRSLRDHGAYISLDQQKVCSFCVG